MVQQVAAPPDERRGKAATGVVPGHRWQARVPGVAAGIVYLIAALCVFSAVGLVLFGHVQPVRRIVDDVVFPAPPNLAYGAFLAVLAAALNRRKALAHRILVAILVLQTIADVVVLVALWRHAPALWSDIDEMSSRYQLTIAHVWMFLTNIVLSLLAIALLVRVRGEFFGRAKRGSAHQAASAFV